ncbi:hypothetical protein CAPTEDRAFT_225743 [Capitella teleta]|uniref:Major facilitator superfamily (MFS) profile domain-containing protein n=1 Tax=Capitella teleta TaxID=283909 RepID=R7VKI9_CAPTE|nr:hypothetical protein CAPTEDRAFT_225743 [Capitella teleta]|eukprot:ELU17411.1 hypothetical protein CAPTEDRAFT_225743 [Capitella teleta]
MAGGGHVAAPNAPDGGWGWMVVMASFTLQALTIGITYTFGVIFVDLLDYFKESQSITAWIGSIQPCLLYLTGIVSGPLIRRFGWRKVTIFGSILSAVGFASSALANNVYVLYFTYGVMTGIGNGLMYVTSMVAVQHYFDKRRAMATGLAVSGSGVGTLTFGLLTRSLTDRLGWRWALVVEGGIMLLGVVCGAIFRPLPQNESNEDTKLEAEANKTDEVVDQSPFEQEEPGCCKRSCDCIDLSYLKNPVFIIYCFSILMFCFGYHVPYTYTPERARQLGIDSKSSSFLVSVMGMANVGSRLLFGWVADRSKGVRFYLAGIMLTLGGVVSVAIPLFTTYPLMVLYSVMFGSFTGSWASLFPVILVDLLGIDSIERSLGQCLAAGSIAFLLASPISGLIIEGTGGNFDTPFIVMGSAEAVGGLVFFFIKCVQRRDTEYQTIDEDEDEGARRQRYISESFS